MQVPELSNQVLLSDLLLDDNSIMSLSSLQKVWLPSIVNLSVAHNRLSVSVLAYVMLSAFDYLCHR